MSNNKIVGCKDELLVLPDGWKLIAVNQHFDDFMYQVERAVRKGNANTDIEDAWDEVDWRNLPAPAAADED